MEEEENRGTKRKTNDFGRSGLGVRVTCSSIKPPRGALSPGQCQVSFSSRAAPHPRWAKCLDSSSSSSSFYISIIFLSFFFCLRHTASCLPVRGTIFLFQRLQPLRRRLVGASLIFSGRHGEFVTFHFFRLFLLLFFYIYR